MVLSTVTAVWGLGHLNPDTVYISELVDQDETRGTAVIFCFLAACFASHQFRRVKSREIRKMVPRCSVVSSASAVFPP